MSEREGIAVSKVPGSPEPLVGRCGAKLPSSERKYGAWRYCLRYPLRGKTRCAKCGGKSLSGMAHPNWKDGAYSVVLKGLRLGDHYLAARQNPALTSHGEQIALVDAKIVELLEQMGVGEGPVAWAKALTAADAVMASLHAVHAAMSLPSGTKDRGQTIAEALKRHEQVCLDNRDVALKGASENETWAHVTQNIYLRKKLSDSEVKRRKSESETMQRGQALAFMGAMLESVKRHVLDAKAKAALVNDMRLLMGGREQEHVL
jgi:hypothetical protein